VHQNPKHLLTFAKKAAPHFPHKTTDRGLIGISDSPPYFRDVRFTLFRILVQKICRAQPNQRSSGEPAFSGSEDRTQAPLFIFSSFLGSFRHFLPAQVRLVNIDRPQPPLADENRGGAGLYFAADFERSRRRFKLSKISGPDSQPLSALRTGSVRSVQALIGDACTGSR
jgi:hypothetical protein